MCKRIATLFLVMASLLLSTGCKMGTGTMTGAALGGALGAVVPAVIGGDVSPAISTLAPVGGALFGGAFGSYLDSKADEEEKQKQQAAMQQQQQAAMQQQQQAAMYQQQMAMQSVRLSCPVAIIIGAQTFVARNGMELAQLLNRMQPGQSFIVKTRTQNVETVIADMASNGVTMQGKPRKAGKGFSEMTFVKNARAQMQQPGQPMSAQQAESML